MRTPSTFAERFRAIVGDRPISPAAAIPAASAGSANGESSGETLDALLGGTWEHGSGGGCLAVERRFDASTSYGEMTIGEMSLRLKESAEEVRLLLRGSAARWPLVFFDLETTGLSGGAGTYAFLVGCAWFEDDGSFLLRQYLLTRPVEEPQLLKAVGREFARAGSLVSFNGRTFDAPLLEMRHAYHRLRWNGGALPHLDVLYPARRFWRDAASQESGAAAEGGCSLVTLERQILAAGRSGDVPGREIPARYFQFVRGGDARLLRPVLDHNRLDLISLAALTVRLLRLLRCGPGAVRHAREALALGQLYGQAGLDTRAREALAHAAGLDGVLKPGTAVRAEALRALALACRRARRHDEAAVCWRQLLAIDCPAHVAREASRALAIHHEHRVRDLTAARTFARRSLEQGRGATWRAAAHDRLSRLERKIANAAARGALDLE